MTDQEKLIYTLLKNLSEQDFERLTYPAGNTEKASLLQELIMQDQRWLAVLPLLNRYLSVQPKSVAYFQTKNIEAWDTIVQQIHGSLPLNPWYSRISRQSISIAASIALVCTATAFLYLNYKPNRYHNSSTLSGSWKTTGAGGSNMILLPDSTRVWLNKNSAIAWIKTGQMLKRKVKLSGEAYFEVKSSPQRPFEVISDQGVVTVTGTHFFTGKDQQKGNFYVDLLEGKVSFQPYGFMPKQAELLPKQQLVYLPGGGQQGYQIKNSAMAKSHLWLRKAVNCDKVPLPEIIRQMQVWYQSDIRLSGNDLKQLHFSGLLSPEDSLATNLDKLSWTSNLSYTRKNNQYIIQSKQ